MGLEMKDKYKMEREEKQMETLADKIANAIERYHVLFMRKKVLKTVEEIEATTNPLEKYIAGAGAVNELYNNLNGCSFEQDGEDFYIVGADAVRKKLGSASVVYKNIVDNVNTVTTSEYTCKESGDYYIFAYAISGGATNAAHVSYDFSCDGDEVLTQNLGR